MRDSGDKLAAADKSAIESATEGLRKAIESSDSAAIDRAMEELTRAQHKAAEALYQQAAPGAGPTPGGGAEPGSGSKPEGGRADGDVIDAEVVDEGKP